MKKTIFLTLFVLLSIFSSSISLLAQAIGSPLENKEGLPFSWTDNRYSEPKTYSMILRIENNNFRLFFLDEEGLIARPPVARAAIRAEWKKRLRTKNRTTKEEREQEIFTALVPTPSADSLLSKRFLQSPFIYYVVLTLQGRDKDGNFQNMHTFPKRKLSQGTRGGLREINDDEEDISREGGLNTFRPYEDTLKRYQPEENGIKKFGTKQSDRTRRYEPENRRNLNRRGIDRSGQDLESERNPRSSSKTYKEFER